MTDYPQIEKPKKELIKKYKFDLNEQVDEFINKIENSPLIVNRLDYYGNTIPLGAFCFAVSFILYGFSDCNVLGTPDNFTFLVLLLFGGLGQITAGIFEYIKSRTFPTACYLLYGLYFISFFLGNLYPKTKTSVLGRNECKKIFYGTWAGLSFPILIASIKTNVVYFLQNLAVCGFFVVRCIGECQKWNILNEMVSGILQLVTGFLSLYLCFSQVLNEHFKCTIFPTFPINKDNEIDISYQLK